MLTAAGKDRRDSAGDIALDRHFDEDQRFVDECRMKERKAATVWRIDAAAQIVPAADFVDRLVADDFFQHDRRRRPVDTAQHEKATIEPGRKQMHEIGIDGGKVLVPVIERVHQLFAHAHQRGGTARRKIESAKQLLPPGLGCGVNFGSGQVRGIGPPGLDRLLHARGIGSETLGQGFEERNARARREFGIAHENFTRERNARGLSAPGQEVLAQFDQTFGTSRRSSAPVTRQQRATALGDGLQQFPEKRRVHFTVTGPMIWSGNHVAMPGARHNITTPRIISPTKGSTPHITSRKGMSGAILLMTKILSPTGG